MTVEPRSACVFSPGCVPMTSPLGTVSEDRSRTRTRKPAASRRRRASASLWPSTPGTVAVPGPSETVSVTTEPSSASPPGSGSWPSTSPFGRSDVRATVSTEKPSRWSAACAVAEVAPDDVRHDDLVLAQQQQGGEQDADRDDRDQREEPPAPARPAVVLVLGRRRGGVPERRGLRGLGRPDDGGRAQHGRVRRRAGVRQQPRAGGGERVDELVGVGVARGGVLLERAQDDLLEPGADLPRCRRSAAPAPRRPA